MSYVSALSAGRPKERTARLEEILPVRVTSQLRHLAAELSFAVIPAHAKTGDD